MRNFDAFIRNRGRQARIWRQITTTLHSFNSLFSRTT